MPPPSLLLQSVYGVPDDGQSQPSPLHISSQPIRKPTKEDVQKEVSHSVTVAPPTPPPPPTRVGHYHSRPRPSITGTVGDAD